MYIWIGSRLVNERFERPFAASIVNFVKDQMDVKWFSRPVYVLEHQSVHAGVSKS